MLFLIGLYILIVTIHEALHIITMKLLNVNIIGIKLIKIFKIIPVAVMILYDKIRIKDY